MTTPSQPVSEARSLEERFRHRLSAGVAKRGAFPFLAGATFSVAVMAGVLARLTDKKDFDSYGDAIWWALVTLTTVGYGDVVPQTMWGRAIGVAVMILGITFISFVTANVTSLFIAADDAKLETARQSREAEVRAILQRIEDDLAEIKGALAERN